MKNDRDAFDQTSGFPLQWSWDVKRSEMTCSEQLPALLGYPEQDSITLAQLLASAQKSQLPHLKQLVKEVYQKHLTRETRMIIDNGSQRFVGLLCVWNDPRSADLIQGTFEVLIRVPSAEVEAELFHYLYVHAKVGMLVLDEQQRIIMVNHEFCRETGFELDELLGVSADIFGNHERDPSLYEKIWKSVAKSGFWIGELLGRDKQGLTFAHELTLQKIQIPSQTQTFYVAISKRLDISMNRWLDSENEDLQTPSLSQLPKVAELKQLMEQIFSSLPADRTMVTFVFQPYFSRNISESMRHWLIGNRLLDIPDEMTIGLLTNELFAGCIVVPRNLGIIHRELQSFVELLHHKVGDESAESDIEIQATVGVSILATDAASVAQMISHASQAMVASRSRGEMSVTYFDHRIQKKMDHKQILARLLDKAIDQGHIDVFYQPIIEMKSLKLVKFEALFRVSLDTKLSYNIQELIQLAEEYGWIDRIDNAVTSRALKDLLVLQKHFNAPELQVSVNRSMSNDRISHCCLEDTLQLVMDARIDPKLVTVELTESSFLADIERQMAWIERLKKEGIEIAIDDFGTGYSSFAYLLQLPINLIKIDRSFVIGLTLGSNEYMMIEMVTSLVHKMGGKVVAEGVEDAETLRTLSHAKVDYVQGFLFSKPLSMTHITSGKIDRYFSQYERYLVAENADRARDIMMRDYPRIGMDHKLDLARQRMHERQVNFLVVLENSSCCGILREAELNAAISPYIGTESEQQRDLITLNRRVHQVMRKGGYDEVSSDCEISVVRRLFQANADTIVIVTGESGVCIGIITPEIILQIL
ncbi:EAL domain-containing protein [Celerinatantimonas sp. YJH-8]|uniref:EAL domain-containing protein n=1 Tax=Celerinatantimonas sp. YJH-8 TaxID=3228714 RepID=UPI0038C9799D